MSELLDKFEVTVLWNYSPPSHDKIYIGLKDKTSSYGDGYIIYGKRTGKTLTVMQEYSHIDTILSNKRKKGGYLVQLQSVYEMIRPNLLEEIELLLCLAMVRS